MAKGYNKKNKLKQIIRVQEEYLKYSNSGRTVKYIYDTYIYPKFLISMTTFYNYLATPAKRDLERIDKSESQQLTIFGDVKNEK